MVGPAPRQGPATRTGEPSEAEAWALLLTVTGLGPAGFGALLREHGGGLAILDAAARPGAAAAFAATAEAADGRTAFGLDVGRAIVELARATDEPLRELRDSDVAHKLRDSRDAEALYAVLAMPSASAA